MSYWEILVVAFIVTWSILILGFCREIRNQEKKKEVRK